MDDVITIIVPNTFFSNIRLDKVLSQLYCNYSRTCFKKWILNCQVSVNDRMCDNPNMKVSCGDKITVNIINCENGFENPQNIPLNVVYEDNDILVIDKQVNLVVHPGAGHKDGTLLNALLYKSNTFLNVPRAGIIHRLDKNTTGLMVIAKNLISYNNLVELMKCRKIVRQYEALVYGRMISGGTICRSIKRHPVQRTIMTTNVLGRKAITHYRIIKRLSCCTHIRIKLETGRTHQIRVHMLSINHPLIGDSVYRNKHKFCKSITLGVYNIIKKFPRPALHASKLCLKHPITGQWMEWDSVFPNDIANLLNELNVNESK
ncbi:MAG: 23S rRNA pseudouridine(1911/1915/1917) synthase RluD [Buchnera aphidicola (Meitanaphis elongallis)]